jgi:hypothetical protein
MIFIPKRTKAGIFNKTPFIIFSTILKAFIQTCFHQRLELSLGFYLGLRYGVNDLGTRARICVSFFICLLIAMNEC